jgi:hypothetical protein
MKKVYVLMVCMMLCGAALFAQTARELQDMYMDYLREEGYVPSVDSDGDIAFKVEGGSYYIIVDEDDPTYFIILYPNFWEIESEEERALASDVIMYVNDTTKVAKIYITSWDDTSIEAGIFLNTAEDFVHHFPRMMTVMRLARQKFIDGMDE